MVNHVYWHFRDRTILQKDSQVPLSQENSLSQFAEGTALPYGPLEVTKEDIIAFAEKYDPIYFHLDEEKAKTSLLGGLAASGFHTCALTMRMICDAYLLGSTSQGSPGVDDLKWHVAVRPGDVLHGRSIILSSRISGSRPDLLVLKLRHETYNQDDVLVLTMINTGFMRIAGVPDGQ